MPVAGDRPGVQRAFDGDPDRRPETGDLCLPRRRHRHVSARGGQRRTAKDAGHQLAQRRTPGRQPAGRDARRAARRPQDRGARGRGQPQAASTQGCAAQRALPAARGVARHVRHQTRSRYHDGQAARSHQRGPGRRHLRAAVRRNDLLRRTAEAGRHRGDRRDPQGRPRVLRCAGRGGHPGGVHR